MRCGQRLPVLVIDGRPHGCGPCRGRLRDSGRYRSGATSLRHALVIGGPENPGLFLAERRSLKYWNHTPLLTWAFDALSPCLTAGEAMVERVVLDHLQMGCEPSLSRKLNDLLSDERSHRRAHQRYNRQLDALGYRATRRAEAIDRSLVRLEARLSDRGRLALAASFEAVALRISRACLSGHRWLAPGDDARLGLWRWHAREEVAHAHVVQELARDRGVSEWLVRSAYPIALALLAFDVLTGVVAYAHRDLCLGRVRAADMTCGLGDLLHRMRGTLGMNVGASWGARSRSRPRVRTLDGDDVPALLALEARKWYPSQRASREMLEKRLTAFPELCLGAFDASSGAMLASLFMVPASRHDILASTSWAQLASGPHVGQSDGTLFGVSLTSIDSRAVGALLAYFWPRALKRGCRSIILSTPMPGFRQYCAMRSGSCPADYAHTLVAGHPLDPQLRYYAQRGFDRVLAVKGEYFDSPESLNWSAILEGRVPFGTFARIWRRCPHVLVRVVCAIAIKFADPLKRTGSSRNGRRRRISSVTSSG